MIDHTLLKPATKRQLANLCDEAKQYGFASVCVNPCHVKEAAKLLEGMKVDILDVNNGERFQTYVIKGKRGNGDICLNGAAARKVAIGDKVIIVSYAMMTLEEKSHFEPAIVMVDEKNKIVKKL